jgi:hypothetical protein
LDGLIVEHLGGDVLVYDSSRYIAHSLNGIAAAVFVACDGSRSVEAIAAAAADRLDEHVSSDQVEEILGQLDEIALLERDDGLSRREAVGAAGRLGGALIGGSVAITTLAVPTAAQAQSGPQGVDGFQGFQGFQGPATGFQGAQGFVAPMAAGAQSVVSGFQGPQGFQGPAGGFQGPQGFGGFTPYTVTEGQAGPMGFQGPPGPIEVF